MQTGSVSPLVLIILDGWGYREETEGNAIAAANTPVMDSLWSTYPKTLLQASGKDVGLPKGQMGNSEVGHLNIGAGRVVPQELVRISDAVDDGSLLSNPVLVTVCEKVKANKSKLHLLGLCSDGGVHSHIDHLLGLLDLAKAQQIEDVCIHVITDGRDTLSHSGINFIKLLQAHINKIGVGRIVTIIGRYFAMDRDKRWDRVQKAYEVMTDDRITTELTSPTDFLEAAYKEKITDEFLPPTRIAHGAIASGDGVICFNFRPDRSREISQALVAENFTGFERKRIEHLAYATFTQYDSALPVPVVFLPQNLTNLLGPVVAKHGMKQLRLAETEKYAHVTYFFDGGMEEASEGDDRILVNSPRVSTYDQQPEMSAAEVTRIASEAIAKRIYSLIVINYANPDMVGHTGNFEATVKALEHVDRCLGRLLSSIGNAGGTALITADHGNAEYMWDEHGNPWTAHSSNPVPFILVEGEVLKIYGHGADVKLKPTGGRLADIAPTILEILQIEQPEEMTGVSLLEKAIYEIQAVKTPVKIG
ncbi:MULTISPECIES: 2,3-bisphosphoglycerate-independent phosphoglycerate mutase [Pseudanabaena]|uniref:2,3-bisphosphoglycerate-independent phosphoglycerate mutase n=2 Tax=Pseudanabaena TaxID=1152 RepID=L8N0T0_9CYAN|nr:MULTISPECIES: 2,3-bisphosphoglycerate-independent phosphoglycerate mutase [Pseudanabaena]ELS32340.1 2,3-bisphosphoglycerate-independent phosphoglycerate mutase [Pseudanabaena biceps PCC 7429]MDG3495433.1 2,3-bisphosphoglycerate-independent phosphoglycerate mutase [Pseudanabaena catenata USMAC16]